MESESDTKSQAPLHQHQHSSHCIAVKEGMEELKQKAAEKTRPSSISIPAQLLNKLKHAYQSTYLNHTWIFLRFFRLLNCNLVLIWIVNIWAFSTRWRWLYFQMIFEVFLNFKQIIIPHRWFPNWNISEYLKPLHFREHVWFKIFFQEIGINI